LTVYGSSQNRLHILYKKPDMLYSPYDICLTIIYNELLSSTPNIKLYLQGIYLTFFLNLQKH
jgi:hypothetical protein